jgi:hypothetical protein
MAARGVLLHGDRLRYVSDATTVQVRRAELLVSDGPFAETKELIAGYWLIQVKSKPEALEWAERVPAPHGAAAEGEIELRQLYELDDFGPSAAIGTVNLASAD